MNRMKWVSGMGLLLGVSMVFLLTSQPGKLARPKLSKAATEQINALKSVYKTRKLKECTDRALARASYMADSILLEQALFIGGDTISRPPRPDRPFPETFDSPLYGVPVRPFLKRSDFISPFQKKDTFATDSLRIIDSIRRSKIKG